MREEPAEAQPPVVQRIAEAQRRKALRFRLTFALTWFAIIGLLVTSLLGAGRFSLEFLEEWFPYILEGAWLTIFVSLCSIVVATALAVVGALGRISHHATIYAVASLYVSLVRGTPLLVQLLFVYLALPQILPASSEVPVVVLGILALGFNYGAYMTEIFRAGLEAVPRGQVEAAGALGMSEAVTLRLIVIPQAVRIVIPAIGNEFIGMIKDSSLISVVTVQEMLWRAQHVGASHFRSLETLLVAALVYWVLTAIFSIGQGRLERRMAAGDRRAH